MNAAIHLHSRVHERLEFAPPQQRGLLRALGLAILAHALLVAGLSLSVQWKSEAPTVAVEAELWSAVPQQAAPKLEAPPPEPEPEPQPQPQKVAEPEPAPTPPVPDPAIVLEKEKKRKAAEDQARQQQLLLQQKQEADKKRLQKLEQERLEKEKKDKKLAEEKRQAEQDKLKQTQKDKAKTQEDAKKLEAQRRENVNRMMGLAGGTGAPTSTGTAQKSSGLSASYAGKIVARVRPNIVFTDDAVGNPSAVVRVRTAPDGTIVGKQLITSSGVKAWDDAVLRALDKTETLPKDIDGRVPATIDIGFKPKD